MTLGEPHAFTDSQPSGRSIGLDTGGTYTDAVLFDAAAGVVRTAKALTTKHNLALGIGAALDAILSDPTEAAGVRLVALSTTLATNAVVEGEGSPVGLILIGYPADALKLEGLGAALGEAPVVFVDGGHTVSGDEQAPLDREAARAALLALAPQVSALAISGYFSVLNPSHELAVRALAQEVCDLPVTCGHELTRGLNAPRRALTTVLNARLIPLLTELLAAVTELLTARGITAPLLVVKGDGSLITAAVARQAPIETILSGPAASVVGARWLSGEAEVLVADMGGTTTDLALLTDGRPRLNPAGARLGAWQTMVAAIDVQTTGLGGDSEVQITPETGVTVGPRRMVPLSLLGSTYPEVLTVLRDSLGRGQPNETSGGFVLRRRGGTAATLDPYAAEVWAQLGETPLPLEALLGGRSRAFARRHGLASLLKLGWVSLAGFTPSDAAHILGRQATWSLEAARLGAEVWTRRARQLLRQPELTPDGFCTLVMEATMLQLGRAVARAALGADVPEATGPSGDWVRRFLDRALAADGAGDPADLLEVSLHLRRPLAAIGAPVATYFPEVARRLGTRLVIPPYAEVANAVGAVVGSVAQTVTLRIQPLDAGASYRVHLPEGIADFPTLNAAAAHAEEVAAAAARALAGRAGAPAPQVTVTRIDHIFYPPDGGRAEIYLDSEVSATAIGRPGF